MALDDHRKPDGNYDGVGAMAEISGLTRDVIIGIAAQVKANQVRLDGCPWHEFEVVPQDDGVTPQARLSDKYRCRHCQGEVDAIRYRWHQLGRRPMPVGEPQPVNKGAVGYLCIGGPLDGKMLAHGSSVYPVSRLVSPDGVSATVADPSTMPRFELSGYLLDLTKAAWIFQGWPE